MFAIGDIKIKNRIVSAPMAGVSDLAFRILAKEFSCGLCLTEMVNDMGLIYGQEKTFKIADINKEEPPVATQLFGSDPENMAKGAKILQDTGAQIIDINMGCPAPKIVKNGGGAALMQDLEKSRQIIRNVVKAVNVPITVKMRSGWEDNDRTCLELAEIAEVEGAKAVTIHPRSRRQFFSGKANWYLIKEVKKILSINVIGNGDIETAEDALRMLDYTACDAVMIGRAAMGNPFIFRECVELIENGVRIPSPSIEERIAVASRHLDLACQYKGEGVATREMRKHIAWYTRGLHSAARLRAEINTASSKEEMLQILNSDNSTKENK